MASPDEVLQKIERHLQRLEGRSKDRWDKFHILAGLLIPVAVGYAGYHYSTAVAKAQQIAEMQRAEVAQMLSETTTRVSQAELISSFMRSLLSNNPAEKELAIRAIILALPEAGPQLVAVIQVSSVDQRTKDVARQALDERRQRLVKDLYAMEAPVRDVAAKHLVAGFGQDPALIDQIAAEAEKQKDNPEGLRSSAMVLGALPDERLQARQETVEQFTRLAEQSVGPSPEALRRLTRRPPPPRPVRPPEDRERRR